MIRYSIVRTPIAPFLVAFLFIVSACGPAAQMTANPTTSPTNTELPDTMTPSQTPEPTLTPTLIPMPTSTPLPEIDLLMELPEGDPDAGFLTAIRNGCEGCHANESFLTYGPRFGTTEELPFILERGEMRIALADYNGRATTNEEYMMESIFLPEAYLVPGDWEEPMPTNYGDKLTDQDLADILAWIDTLK